MQLVTDRLRIVPLTPRQLGLWLHDVPELESELGCRCTMGTPTGEFRRIVGGQYAVAITDPEHYPLHTFWLLITREDGAAVGSACFKGMPDAGGRVEIGYGLEKACEKQGYMTESVRELCAWVKRQPGVLHVVAETDADNSASQRVLQRAGFRPALPGSAQWWIL